MCVCKYELFIKNLYIIGYERIRRKRIDERMS